jgi:general secretion pathway protein M
MIRAWWAEKNRREKGLCVLLLAILAGSMGWLMVIKPLNDSINARIMKVQHLKEDLAWMQSQASAHGFVQSQKPSAPLESIVTEEALKIGVSVQFDASSSGILRIAPVTLPVTSLSRWLAALHYTHGVTIEDLELTTENQPADSIHIASMTLRSQ